MKQTKELEILEKRMKAVEDALGLGSGNAKNINLLLDTIRVQGDEIGNMGKQLGIMHQVLTERDKFMQEKKLYDDFKAWIEAKNKPAADPALEPKDTAGMIERKETTMDEKKEKQIVTEDKSEDAKTAIADSKKEVVND
jgi:hypothetical protein